MLTEITVILDRSGSMQSIASDAIGGFNAFLAAQRREPGVGPGAGNDSTRLTLVLFDDQYEVPYKSIPLTEVPDLTDRTLPPPRQHRPARCHRPHHQQNDPLLRRPP